MKKSYFIFLFLFIFSASAYSQTALYGWGYNSYGQLGDTSTTHGKLSPEQIGTSLDWKYVDCGTFHSLAIKTDGTLWAWGYNITGELGDSTLTDKYLPVQIGTSNDWEHVACSKYHSTAIKSNGSLWEWGYNGGELDSTTISLVPKQIGTDTVWKTVACGGASPFENVITDYTIAIKTDGTLWAWGNNDSCQQGDGTTLSKSSPVQIGTDTNWKSVACGTYHTIAIKTDGTLWAWGWNLVGQLGDSTYTKKQSPVQIGASNDWKAIACGYYHTVALKTDGTLWVWGLLGLVREDEETDYYPIYINHPVQVGTDTIWKSIDCGFDYSMSIKTDGTLWAWGVNRGDLGIDQTYRDSLSIFNPVQIGSGISWAYVTTGCLTTMALRIAAEPTLATNSISNITNNSANSGGNVIDDGGYSLTYRGVCWNTTGNPSISDSHSTDGTGHGTFTSNITDLSPATYYYVKAYGTNLAGTTYGSEVSFWTLSNEPSTHSNSFNATVFGSSKVKITFQAANDIENCSGFLILRRDGSTPPNATGITDGIAYRELILPEGTTIIKVITDKSVTSFDDIDLSNGTYSYAFVPFNWDSNHSETYNYRTSDTIPTVSASPGIISGNIFGWGDNYYGQLGDGTTTERHSPVAIGTVTNWNSVASNGAHTVGIKTDGTLWAWGSNGYGQLGNGSTIERHSPVRIGTASNWKSVSCGQDFTIATKTDGTLWAWGNNSYGQLGNGTTVDIHFPIQIGTETNWKSVACGYFHTIAVKQDGTLWSWGWNYNGQLGDSSTTQRNSPVQIGTGTNWKSAACGYFHTTAIKNDLTLWSWGWNYNGQLGDSSTTQRTSPVQIGTGRFWQSVTGSDNHTMAIKTDGSLWAWGDNSLGQLGNGTTTESNTPVQIGTGTDWGYVAAGDYSSIGIMEGGITPTLTTQIISNIANRTANSGGNITDDGGHTITARGVCWNTSGSPSITDTKTSDGTGSGTFTSSLTGLNAGTTYYVRAYATNDLGTFYGNQISFTTLNSKKITVSITGSGSVSPLPNSLNEIYVDIGGSVTLNFTPSTCNNITNVTVDGTSFGTESSHNFTSVNSDHTVQVTFADITPPTISAPANVTVNADAGMCTASSVTLGTPTTGDNCSVVSVTNNAPTTFNVGTTTVTWTVTDAQGNTSTATQTVTVNDNQAPTITAPANVTVNADAGLCSTNSVTLGTPTTGDNCGVASVTNNAPTAFNVGTTTVTWTVTDVHGNTNTATQTVTVNDNQAPTITAPANKIVNADAGLCTASSVTLGAPTTGDNCGVASVTNNAPTSFNVGTTTVTWTVTDVHGNTNTATQTVTVNDNQAPSITAPDNITVNADAGSCTVSSVALGTPTTGDNCGVYSVTNNAPTTFNAGITTVTWTVTDVNGNTNTATQTVTVHDSQAPTITAPFNVTVNADAGLCSASSVALGTPTTGDNCSVVSVTNNAPTTFNVGTTTVTWTVTDVSGNTNTATQTVTVNDNQAPTISVTVSPTYLWPANRTMSTISASVSASDNCSGATYVLESITANETLASNDIQNASYNTADLSFSLRADKENRGNGRIYTITYKSTDASGNISRATATVAVPRTRPKEEFEDYQLSTLKSGLITSVYPNPSDNSVNIIYNIPEDGKTKIEIYDNLGNVIASLLDNYLSKGERNLIWDGTNKLGVKVSNGVYYIKITSGMYTESYPVKIIR